MEEDYKLDLDLEGGRQISIVLEDNLDLFEELMVQYGISRSEQLKRLCDSASAMRIKIKEEHGSLTPIAYLQAAIDAVNDNFRPSSTSPTVSEAISTLISLISILLPLVPSESLDCAAAGYGVTALLPLLKNPRSPATTRSVIKSIGFLVKQCNLKDGEFAKSVLEMILEFSIDKRREEVREFAQVWVEEIYKSIQGTSIVNEVSELFHSKLFYEYLPFAIAVAWPRFEITVDSEKAEELMLMESVHMLTVLKLIIQYLSNDVVVKVMSEIHKILGSKFSLVSRPNFALLKAMLDSPRADEIIGPKLEIVIFALVSYVSQHNNPADTILSALILLKRCIDKLYTGKRSIWLFNLPSVFEALASVVGARISVSEEAARIMRELVNQHINDDQKALAFAFDATLPSKAATLESKTIESVCAVIKKMELVNSDGKINENVLSVVSHMILKLGEFSHLYLSGVVTELQRVLDRHSTTTNYQDLQAALAVLGKKSSCSGR